jgi:3D (Asp-Asp-Asp) domain-containing protein
MPELKSIEEIQGLLEICDKYIEEWESNHCIKDRALCDGESYAAMLAQRDFLTRLQMQIMEEKERKNPTNRDEIEPKEPEIDKVRTFRDFGGADGGVLFAIVFTVCIIGAACALFSLGFRDGKGIGYNSGYLEGHDAGYRIACVEKSRVRRFKVTAYCACVKCCGEWADGYTADGSIAVGALCAAGKGVPFGTKYKVPGRGWVRVADRGSDVDDNDIDLLFLSHDRAKEWGVQYLDCEVVE